MLASHLVPTISSYIRFPCVPKRVPIISNLLLSRRWPEAKRCNDLENRKRSTCITISKDVNFFRTSWTLIKKLRPDQWQKRDDFTKPNRYVTLSPPEHDPKWTRGQSDECIVSERYKMPMQHTMRGHRAAWSPLRYDPVMPANSTWTL